MAKTWPRKALSKSPALGPLRELTEELSHWLGRKVSLQHSRLWWVSTHNINRV
ncbi:rCG20788, partial [Rattus norvegicus]